MDSNNSSEEFPPEMKQSVRELHESLSELKQLLNEFNSNYSKIKSKTSDPLLKAKLELTNAYAINSLFWIYLSTKGVNPYEHGIKDEIIRLKGYMERVQQIEDKQSSMKLDTNAAKRFIRSALWEPNEDIVGDNKRKLSQTQFDESKESIESIPNTIRSSDWNPSKKKKKLND